MELINPPDSCSNMAACFLKQKQNNQIIIISKTCFVNNYNIQYNNIIILLSGYHLLEAALLAHINCQFIS